MAPRDYKHKPAPARRRAAAAAGGSRLGWFTAGALCGVVASVLAWQLGLLAPHLTGARGPAERARPPGARASVDRAPEAADASRPRFEFYHMLPEMEVAVSDAELDEKRPAAPEAAGQAAPAPAASTYFLQAGSFRVLGEADRQKANLAFLGFEPGIQTVTINGTDTWHRVRVGPFTDLASLNEARARLKGEGVKTMVLRVRE